MSRAVTSRARDACWPTFGAPAGQTSFVSVLSVIFVGLYSMNLRMRARQEGDLAFQMENAPAFQLDAIAFQPATDLAAARRRLERPKLRAAQALRPVRRERAVRATGHGIFRDALGGREIATDEIIAVIA